MLPYFAFFSIAGIPAIVSRRLNILGWIVAWMVAVLFVGLRHRVGGDWGGYVIITDTIGDLPFSEGVSYVEPLYATVCWIASRLGTGIYGVNFTGASIFFAGLFAYCRNLRNPWLGLTAAVPFLAIVTAMSANRQAIAIGVVLFVMSRWGEYSFVRRTLGIGFASGFHSSAAFLTLLAIFDLKMSVWRKALMMTIAGALGFWLLVRSDAGDRYLATYVQEPAEGVYAPGAMFHLLLNLVPAVVMLVSQAKWREIVPNWPLVRQLSITTLVLFALVPFFSVATSRMSLYLFPVSMAFTANLPLLSRSPALGLVIRAASVGVLAVVLALWLTYANTAWAFFPYQNVIFMDSRRLELPH